MFHGINRSNDRRETFADEGDYAAFIRGMGQTMGLALIEFDKCTHPPLQPLTDQRFNVNAVLAEADLCICNSSNLAVESALAGVPVLCLPPHQECLFLVAPIAVAGAARLINPPGEQSTIASAIRHMTGETKYRQAARKLAARYAHLDHEAELDRFIDHLEHLTSSPPSGKHAPQ